VPRGVSDIALWRHATKESLAPDRARSSLPKILERQEWSHLKIRQARPGRPCSPTAEEIAEVRSWKLAEEIAEEIAEVCSWKLAEVGSELRPQFLRSAPGSSEVTSSSEQRSSSAISSAISSGIEAEEDEVSSSSEIEPSADKEEKDDDEDEGHSNRGLIGSSPK